MQLTRRQTLLAAASAAFATALPVRSFAAASVEEFTGGAEVGTGGITLTTPEIAENGNTVPFSVSVDSPMTDSDHVKTVHVFATKNPNPSVVSFNFTPASGKAEATSRMRLGSTQDVIAVAEMSDGKFYMTKTQVKVTIGGCGG